MIVQSEPVSEWCRSCRTQVTLVNVRPWPEGVLVVGECPECHVALASRRPVGWNGRPVFDGASQDVADPARPVGG